MISSNFGRRLNRQISWLLALEDAIDVASGVSALVDDIGAVGHQAATSDHVTERIDSGQLVLGRKRDDQLATNRHRRVRC